MMASRIGSMNSIARPDRNGITRTGTGLAIVGAGVTMLFGTPVHPLDKFPYWLQGGLVLVATGAILLLAGLASLRRSWRLQREWDSAALDSRARRLIGDLRVHSSRLDRLQRSRELAVSSNDQQRVHELDAEIELAIENGDLASEELRRVVELGGDNDGEK